MEFTLDSALLLLGIGLLAGTAAGFIGIGGGVIMVPVLMEVFAAWHVDSESLHQAARGTSLAVAIFSVSSSVFRHHKQGNILWKIVPWIAPASILGGIIAAVGVTYLPGRLLQISLAIILGLAGIKMLFEQPSLRKEMRNLPLPVWALFGLGTGLFAGFTGLGGGLFLIPLMAWIAYVPTNKLAGTSSGVIVFTSAASAISFLLTPTAAGLTWPFVGHVHILCVLCLAATGIPGAQLGAWLNKRYGSKIYKKIFGVLMLIVVIRLFMTVH